MPANLIKALHELGIEPSAREVFELLYLALHLPAPEPLPIVASAVAPVTTDEKPPDETAATAATPIEERPPHVPEKEHEPEPGELYLPQREQPGAGLSAAPFRAPAAVALPGAAAIAKALRPLLRRYPSRTNRELDVERTVRLIADGGPLAAALRPAPERWLDVALVVDEGASMRVWRPTVRELQSLLEGHGAFRAVRRWGLQADDGAAEFYHATGAATRLREARELLDPAGRRLVLVVSDCVAAGWHTGAAFRLLAEWGRHGPVALVQVLPQRLWPGTALPPVRADLRAVAPAQPNAQLQPERNWFARKVPPKGVPLPVLTLSGVSFTPWAQMIAGKGAVAAAGVLIAQQPVVAAAPAPEAAADELTPAARIAQLHAHSETAYELARYLAVVELSMPVLRLVQQALLPASLQVHLAEVFLSGLFYELPAPAGVTPPPDEIAYEFYDGVREELLGTLSSDEQLRVIAEVSLLIEKRLPFADEFNVLIAQAQQADQAAARTISRGRRPFGFISPTALRHLGMFTPAGGRSGAVRGAPENTAVWEQLEAAFKDGRTLTGRMLERTRKGWRVELLGLSAFLPASQLDVRPVRDPERFLQQEIEVRIIRLDRRRGDIVVSRKAALDAKLDPLREQCAAGATLTGRVVKLTITNAYLDLGGLEGALNVAEMSWNPVERPRDLFKVGDEVQVKVISYEREGDRIGLSVKQLSPDPWLDVTERLQVGLRVRGQVVRLSNYGAFVRLADGVEGLIHVADLDWDKRVKHPGEVIKEGQEVEAQIVSLLPETRRLGLALRALIQQPYEFETVTLLANGEVKERRRLSARQFVEVLGRDSRTSKQIVLEMVEIPGGDFLMGAPDREEGRSNDEGPQHKVTVPPFFMGKYAVTQAQWRIVAGWPQIKRELKAEPSRFKGDDRPVERVSWDEAVEFCARLAQKTGRAYRLPSEAEWEYACRAGTTTPFAFGETITHEIVNYWSERPYAQAPKATPREETVPVGSLGVANAFGLYDMHGNVWEWCEDDWHSNYNGAPGDGRAWVDISARGAGAGRVDRGGGWGGGALHCRSANRDIDAPGNRNGNLGFRLLRADR